MSHTKIGLVIAAVGVLISAAGLAFRLLDWPRPSATIPSGDRAISQTISPLSTIGGPISTLAQSGNSGSAGPSGPVQNSSGQYSPNIIGNGNVVTSGSDANVFYPRPSNNPNSAEPQHR
jgi:hypothetical protein